MLLNFGTYVIKAGIEAGLESPALRAFQERGQLLRPPFTPEKKYTCDKARVAVEPVVINIQSERLPLF
jgi:hypothetical protein